VRFDHTQLVIRGRHLPELADLALLTLRRFPALSGWLLLGILPLALMESALLWWLPGIEERDLEYDRGEFWGTPRFLWHYVLLGHLLVPLASLPATLYLGQAMFLAHPSSRQIWNDLRRLAGRWVWQFGVVGGGLWYAIALATLPHNSQRHSFRELVLPGLLTLVLWLIRARAPFVPEIIALERCPIRGRDGQISTRRRSHILHRHSGADLLTRAVLLVPMYTAIFFFALFALVAVRQLLIGEPSWDSWTVQLLVPIAFWMTAGFSIVVRFLSYLDLRIRQEGWEVELLMRAEAARLRAPTAALASGSRTAPAGEAA
jgi:hypothetical protein